MSDNPAISLIDFEDVNRALDCIRRASPIGDTPLKQLVWLRLRLAQTGSAPTVEALDLELGRALIGLISDNVARMRRIAGVPDSEPANRDEAVEAIKADFSRGHNRLEAWSLLYFYYVLADLDLCWQDLANFLGLDHSQRRRRTDLGYRVLAETLSELEYEARAAHHQLWMHFKLPIPSYTTLFGVEDTLARGYDDLLRPEPPHILAVTGPPGIGKTALAHALALRAIEEERFDDVAWLELERAVSYQAVCTEIAAQVSLPALPDADFDDLERMLRVRLSTTPTLVVIDQADFLESPEAVFPQLATLVEPGRLLVTMTRSPSAGAPLRALPAKPLLRDAIDSLLFELARLHNSQWLNRILSDPANVAAIAEAVGGSPLAARLVAERLTTLPLERVLARLGELETETGDGLFARLFEDAWQSAGEDARAAMLALLVMPAGGAEWNDIQPVAGLPPERLDRSLETLVTSSLVQAEEDGLRYSLSALARRFAEAQSRQSPWREMLERIVEAAGRRLRPPAADPDDAPPVSWSQAISLFRQQAGLNALPDDLDRQIAQVAPAARRSGRWPAWRDLMITLVEQLRSSGKNPRGLARALTELGVAQRWLGEHERARADFEEAVTVYGSAGDFIGQAETLLEVGLLCQTLGDREAAFEAYARAADTIGRWRAAALYRRALNGLASLALAARDGAEALKYLETALSAVDEPPDGQTLSNMGLAWLQLGDVAKALDCQKRALAVFDDEADHPRMARAHIRLGTAYHAAGRLDEAGAELSQGLSLMRALGDALGQARALNNLGVIFSQDNRLDEALATWREALDLQTRLDDQVGMAHTHYNLADLLWKLGEEEKARIAMASARGLAEELGLAELIEKIAEHPLNNGAPGDHF